MTPCVHEPGFRTGFIRRPATAVTLRTSLKCVRVYLKLTDPLTQGVLYHHHLTCHAHAPPIGWCASCVSDPGPRQGPTGPRVCVSCVGYLHSAQFAQRYMQ